jgi:hypothetical protein
MRMEHGIGREHGGRDVAEWDGLPIVCRQRPQRVRPLPLHGIEQDIVLPRRRLGDVRRARFSAREAQWRIAIYDLSGIATSRWMPGGRKIVAMKRIRFAWKNGM